MKKVIAVVGPTASGKSALALSLAKLLDGEIVSCDSMQIYKHFDIGTAKPTQDEMSDVVHHMVDIVDPKLIDSYSCAEFVEQARSVIDNILKRKKVPVLCGGTGLYIDNLLSGNVFSQAITDLEYRNELFSVAEVNGNEYVYRMLYDIDPESALATHPNNLKRVIRALEIYHASGITKTEWDKRSRQKDMPYNAKIIGLNYKSRQTLYDRINVRVDAMLKQGLIEEVQSLIKSRALREGTTAAQAIGYKELIGYLSGRCSLEESIENIKRESRRYAKRQITWFSKNDNIHWIYPDEIIDENDRFKNIVNNALAYLKSDNFML